jgi:hypothetical protein
MHAKVSPAQWLRRGAFGASMIRLDIPSRHFISSYPAGFAPSDRTPIMKTVFALNRCALLAIACLVPAFQFTASAAAAESNNVLTAAEKAEGWQLLFDGKTAVGWRAFTSTGLPADKWKVEDGTLHALKGEHLAGDRKSDIITEKKYTDYEFSWDWKLAPRANSGIKYLVTESRPSTPGPEYQMMDEMRPPDAAPKAVEPKAGEKAAKKGGGMPRGLTSTGSFYEILPPAPDKPLKAAGEWNVSKVVVRGKDIEHWLNGKKILSFNLDSPEVKAGIAKSKFKDEPGYGDKIAGHLMLTHHGDEAWFRNLKIRELK